MRIIRHTPLFALLLLIYHVAAFADAFQPQFTLETVALHFPMRSGVTFSLTVGDMLLVAGVALLYLELLKSTRTTKPYLLEHLLSIAVALLFLIEFFTIPQTGTVVFLLLTIMAWLDVLGGLTITLSRHVVLPGTAAGLAVAAEKAAHRKISHANDTQATPSVSESLKTTSEANPLPQTGLIDLRKEEGADAPLLSSSNNVSERQATT